MVESRIGTKITVTQKCYSCTFTTSWDSQPSVRDIPVGNIMLSSSILFGGGSPTKVLKILKHMNVPTICYSTFMNHQKKYLHTAVQRTYQQQQSTLLNNIKAEGRELKIGGDGRCDSPGHSAKYGTYSLMDAEQNKILDSQLVQVCSGLNQKWAHVIIFVLSNTAFNYDLSLEQRSEKLKCYGKRGACKITHILNWRGIVHKHLNYRQTCTNKKIHEGELAWS